MNIYKKNHTKIEEYLKQYKGQSFSNDLFQDIILNINDMLGVKECESGSDILDCGEYINKHFTNGEDYTIL